jgi:hypothetical protein
MDFSLKLSNPSSIAQQQKLELIKSKFEIAATAPEGLVSRTWIRKNILDLTDQDIERIREEREEDKVEDTNVEAAGTAESPTSGGSEESGGEPSGGEEAGGESGGGGIEDLFAGDAPPGDLLTANPRSERENSDSLDSDEESEDDSFRVHFSIKDLDAPVRAERRMKQSTQKLNQFNEPLRVSRKATGGPAKTHMPNFSKMTGIGTTQGSLRDPYGIKNISGLGLGEAADLDEDGSDYGFPVSRRSSMTPDIKSAIDKLSISVKNNKPLILKEADDNEKVDIDLNSIRRTASDE